MENSDYTVLENIRNELFYLIKYRSGMSVNFISETEFFPKDQGVHTAYLTMVSMIREQGIAVSINSFKRSDITHIQTIGLLGLYMLMTRKPAVVSAHLIPESMIGSLRGTVYWLWLFKKYLRFFYNCADLVLAVSPHVKTQLEALGVKSEIKLLPNPVDLKIFRQNSALWDKGRKLLDIHDNKFVFISIGQVQSRKGVADFIKLAKEFPEESFIWIGGKPFKSLTADDNEMRSLMADPPANFYFKGPFNYKDMPAVINAADAFLFPSYQENASMALIEAAACGLPLLLRDIPEYKELYKDGYIACIDTDSFKKNIDKILHDKNYFSSSSKQSLSLAKRFSTTALAKFLVSYYTTLL